MMMKNAQKTVESRMKAPLEKRTRLPPSPKPKENSLLQRRQHQEEASKGEQGRKVAEPSVVDDKQQHAPAWLEQIASLLPGKNHDTPTLGLLAGTTALGILGLLIFAYWFGSKLSSSSSSSKTSSSKILIKGGIKTNAPTARNKKQMISGNRRRAPLDVIVVGCGLPKKGMGWFHLTQLLEMDQVNVRAVVEPFYMNPKNAMGSCQVPSSFASLRESLQAQGVAVVQNLDEIGDLASKPTMCLIAGRTSDNPALFRQCVTNHAAVIYLEKPGAASVDELQDMHEYAMRHNNIPVYMGYNKNVTSYIQQAVSLARQTAHSKLVLTHNNSYTRQDLPEVFVRNAEGIMKNMAIHELALLVTYFGVTVDTVRSITVNTSKLFSEKLQIPIAPSAVEATTSTTSNTNNSNTSSSIDTTATSSSSNNNDVVTDFSRVAFKITDTNGETISIFADRCGGNISFAMVQDEQGREVAKFEFPSDGEQGMVWLDEQMRAEPDMMPYFFIQGPDYLELKRRVVDATLDKTIADGVATLQVGLEAMKLAEYVNAHLDKAIPTTIDRS